MKRLIDFCLLLLMVFWGSNAWADKTMTFSATSPTNGCNLTKLNVSEGSSGSIENGGITLQITAASGANASWNTAVAGSNHGQTIGLAKDANITISSSAEMKITKIVFHFETNNKGYFTESSTTGGTLDPKEATSYVTTQTWSSDQGASSVSLINNSSTEKAYITSIDITYKTGGLDNYTVQAYPYTWNFTDESLWNKSESQFVSEIWTYYTNGVDEWRNDKHEPTVATGYDVDLLRGLRFTGHICADKERKCVSLPRTATITIPSLHKGQKVKISYTGVDILPTTNLKVFQERKDNIEIYKVIQDGDAKLTIDPNGADWGVWISQISVLDAAPVLTMTTPYGKAPLTTRIILSANTTIKNSVTATLKGESADGSPTHDIGTVTGIANGNKLVFTPKEGQQLRPNYTYTLHLTEKAELQNVEGGKFEDDTFVFTTAKVKGNAPIVESTSPAKGSTIKVEDVQPTTPKQIKITFNEDIQLLDGALIFCRPMGGSESYTSLEYYSGRSDKYNSIHHAKEKENELSFDYSGQNLFYGMRYEVTIPTYAIVGNGGQPMDKNFTFYFETPKSKEATDSRKRTDVYTWDFTNISEDSWSKLEESATANNSFWGKGTVNNRSAYGSFGANKSDKRRFNQNQEIRFGDGNVMKELRGILFTLVNNQSNRFCICPATTTETSYIDMTGGTHYMTLQDVPTGSTIFVEYTDQFFNLNSINVDSLRTYQNDLLHNVSMYKVTSTGDVSFCFQNLKLYRIAIVKDNKTIGSAEKNYIKYATYSQSYPVDYSLNKRLNGTAVTAYSVSADYQSNATFVNFTELPNNQSASDEGVILKTSGKLGESHPIFTTDVNTTPQELPSNALVGTGDKVTEFATAKKEGYQNYILTTKYFHLDENENPSGEVIDGNQQCFYKWVKGDAKRNFAYLQLKNPSNANAAKTVIYLDWFGDTTGIHGMTAPSQVTSGKTYYTLDGRKVTSPTQKGIYIINGKKIIIK